MDSVHDDVMIRNFDYHAVCKGNRTEPIQSLYKDIETFVGFSGIFCQNGTECVGWVRGGGVRGAVILGTWGYGNLVCTVEFFFELLIYG